MTALTVAGILGAIIGATIVVVTSIWLAYICLIERLTQPLNAPEQTQSENTPDSGNAGIARAEDELRKIQKQTDDPDTPESRRARFVLHIGGAAAALTALAWLRDHLATPTASTAAALATTAGLTLTTLEADTPDQVGKHPSAAAPATLVETDLADTHARSEDTQDDTDDEDPPEPEGPSADQTAATLTRGGGEDPPPADEESEPATEEPSEVRPPAADGPPEEAPAAAAPSAGGAPPGHGGTPPGQDRNEEAPTTTSGDAPGNSNNAPGRNNQGQGQGQGNGPPQKTHT